MAKERVTLRVSKGGHNIPPDVIERRYRSGLKNFFAYMLRVDNWFIFESHISPAVLIAEGERDSVVKIFNLALWERLREM